MRPPTPVENAEVTAESALAYYETTKKDSLQAYLDDRITLAQYNNIRACLCTYKSKHERQSDEYMVDKRAEDFDAGILKALDELKTCVKNGGM